jgi:hypothetical protein
MIAKVSCAALMGIDAFKVELEVDFSRSGMPCFTMVGLAEGAVVKDVPVFGVENLGQAVRLLLGEEVVEPASVAIDTLWAERTPSAPSRSRRRAGTTCLGWGTFDIQPFPLKSNKKYNNLGCISVCRVAVACALYLSLFC